MCLCVCVTDGRSVSQGALGSSSSRLVLPAVSWPASNAVIGQLQEQLDTSPLYMDPETLSQLRLNGSSPALLVFGLPYGTGYDAHAKHEGGKSDSSVKDHGSSCYYCSSLNVCLCEYGNTAELRLFSRCLSFCQRPKRPFTGSTCRCRRRWFDPSSLSLSLAAGLIWCLPERRSVETVSLPRHRHCPAPSDTLTVAPLVFQMR